MYFLHLIAESVEMVDGAYPGGSGANNPVPPDVAYYLSPPAYGIFGIVVLVGLLWLVTRLNADR